MACYPAIILIAIGSLVGCGEGTSFSTLAKEGVFEPQTLDFGILPLGNVKALPVRLKNTERDRLTIDRVQVPAGFRMRGLKRALEGRTIAAGRAEDLEITFEPNAEGPVSAQLLAYSGDLEITLVLQGEGRARLPVMLAVTPEALDFGVVAVGRAQTRTFEVVNTGSAAGEITGLTWGSTGNATAPEVFSVVTPLPLVVEPGARTTVELAFSPTNGAQWSDTVTFLAADHPALSVSMVGGGLEPLGDIVCSPTQIEFGDVSRGQTAAEAVSCEALGGSARIISAEVSGSSMFRLTEPVPEVDVPSGASTEISVSFQPDGLPSSQEGTLVIRYESAAGPGAFTVPLSGEVVPPPPTETDISLVLNWPTADTDIDLHLVAPGGSFFHPELDCSYINFTPEWGEAGVTEDNPFLDRDDTDGYGPENINLTHAAPGTYEIYVHYYSNYGQGPSDATIEVHLGGQSVYTRQIDNLECNERWHVGTIEWNGTEGTFTANGTRSFSDWGFCF